MVYIWSRTNANKKCARSQAFVLAVQVGEENSVAVSSRYQVRLGDDHRAAGMLKSRLYSADDLWIFWFQQKEKELKKKGPQFYMLWETDTDKEKMRRIHDHVSAPKRDLPGKFRRFFLTLYYSKIFDYFTGYSSAWQ